MKTSWTVKRLRQPSAGDRAPCATQHADLPGEAITVQCDPEQGHAGLGHAQGLRPSGVPRFQWHGRARGCDHPFKCDDFEEPPRVQDQSGVEGLKHVYSWLMRHSSFLFNCFGVCVRGAPPFEVVYGRRFRAKMVPFGELVLFHRASKHRGELQWLRCVAWAQ